MNLIHLAVLHFLAAAPPTDNLRLCSDEVFNEQNDTEMLDTVTRGFVRSFGQKRQWLCGATNEWALDWDNWNPRAGMRSWSETLCYGHADCWTSWQPQGHASWRPTP